MAEYKGSVEIHGGFTPKGGRDFPLMQAKDIQVDDTGKRLDEKLAEMAGGGSGGGVVTVTVDSSDGTASHSSVEIYSLIQAGTDVVAPR